MKGKHVLFGISPFNSKFDENYIKNMLEWGFHNYEHVDVLHPHEEAKYLLMGSGDNEVKACKKSRKEFYRMERTINDYLAMSCCNFFSKKILKFSDFYSDELYKKNIEIIREDFKKNEDFRALCIAQSYKAIFNRKNAINKASEIRHQDIIIATEYILREIPFILSPSSLLSSLNSVHISYYCSWPIADYIYAGKLSITPNSGTKIVVKDHSI
ncbi:tRNA-dependent cyclodipeptide synthase [Gilliamella apicola]|uniref:tRNA-dependent cyclodipeptide synthase n=1 Tax=Gilliamella apicola TaxID=1196095 RepID=UPI002FEE2472